MVQMLKKQKQWSEKIKQREKKKIKSTNKTKHKEERMPITKKTKQKESDKSVRNIKNADRKIVKSINNQK